MSVNISDQDILNVFLESDTDEEDCLIDENVTQQEDEFTQNLNHLDHAGSYIYFPKTQSEQLTRTC